MRSNHSYFQINEAYKKLTSVMEGKDNLKGDDQHEIAAFMRMFMDMVGMADADSIPSGNFLKFLLFSSSFFVLQR